MIHHTDLDPVQTQQDNQSNLSAGPSLARILVTVLKGHIWRPVTPSSMFPHCACPLFFGGSIGYSKWYLVVMNRQLSDHPV